MKIPLCTAAAFVISLSAIVAEEEAVSTVRFANGDKLSGSLESLAPDRLGWKSPVLGQPASFFLSQVLDVDLAAEQPVLDSKHEASVTLTNGDHVRGQLAAVSDDSVELDTWFAERLKFNRLMVSGVKIDERPELLYRGPTGLDGWTRSGEKPVWTFQNSSFRSSGEGSIARAVNLPDECSVAFDVSWRGSISLKLVLFSDDVATDRPTTGYELRFEPRSIQLRGCKSQKFLGHTPNATALQENEKARIEVRASAKSGKVCVLVDGQMVDQPWVDPDVARMVVGRGIHFISLKASPVHVSRIEVGAWDGETEALPDPQLQPAFRQFGIREDVEEEPEAPPEPKPDGQRMELRNGDSIAGEVVGISEGKITVKTPFRELKLPIEALRNLTLKPVDAERCKRENGDVRAWFPDGSSIVFRLESVEQGMLTGYSQNFGTARFRMSAFSRIEFNIYNPDLDELRNAGGG